MPLTSRAISELVRACSPHRSAVLPSAYVRAAVGLMRAYGFPFGGLLLLCPPPLELRTIVASQRCYDVCISPRSKYSFFAHCRGPIFPSQRFLEWDDRPQSLKQADIALKSLFLSVRKQQNTFYNLLCRLTYCLETIKTPMTFSMVRKNAIKQQRELKQSIRSKEERERRDQKETRASHAAASTTPLTD